MFPYVRAFAFFLVCAGAASGAAGEMAASGGKIRVACVGDSITEGSGYPAELERRLGPAYEVRNFGVSGATLLRKGEKPWLKDAKAEAAFAFDPHHVVIMLGTNDTKPQNYRFVAEFEDDLTALVQRFAARPAKPRVWLATPCPVFFDGNWGIDSGRLNEGVIPAIRKTAAALQLPLIDMHAALSGRADLFYQDHVHPLGGARPMAGVVYAALTGRPVPLAKTPPPPEPIRVACLGDSITAGSGYPAALQGLLGNRYHVRNFGVNGATLLREGDLPYVRERAWAAALEFRPQAVLLMLGTNDTKPQNYAKIGALAADLGALLDTLAALVPPPNVLLCQPVPVFGKGNYGIDDTRLKEGVLPVIARVAAERGIPLVDMNAALRGRSEFFKDRVHPIGAEGLLARTAFEALRRALPPAPVRKNLLANAGAEQGTDGWITRGGELEIVAAPVHGGARAIKVSGRNAAWHGPGQQVAPELRRHGPGWYRIGGSVRLVNGAKAASARIQVLMSNGVPASQTRMVAADEWTEFDDMAYLAWSGELKSAVFSVEVNDPTADVLADDLVLEPLDAPEK